MSLVTRCPVCATAFHVQRAQLAAHSGTVRCGKCAAVFDGVAGLVEEGAERLSIEPSPQLGLFDPGRRDAATADAGAALPAFMEEAVVVPHRRLLWGALSILVALLLCAQVVARYRAELSAAFPALHAPLTGACHFLGCDVTLPRRPDLMSIDSSELQTDARREDVIVLNAVIRNRARFAQDYPSLELTLTDEAEQPLVRRVLAPREYLDAPRAAAMIAEGIPDGGEVPLKVFLYAERVRATGYRIYLFYPL